MCKKLCARDPFEPDRTATPLELFFDLCFVVAIAQSALSLHHGIIEGHIIQGLISYLLVFFAIWWAWMNFTWFASAYDNDDSCYRLKVFLQMTGMLVLAAGISNAFNNHDYVLITLGYTLIRIGMILMWWRASNSSIQNRKTARVYAFGLTVCQLGWITIAMLDYDYWIYGWGIFVIGELLVPVIGEKQRSTNWHPHHISERYGLFLIIVIGESVLGATTSIQTALNSDVEYQRFLPVIVSSPIIFFSMWWIYFIHHYHFKVGSSKKSFIWAYLHFFIYASAAAVGVGISLVTDFYNQQHGITNLSAGLMVSVPSAIFLVFVYIVQRQFESFPKNLIKIYIFGTVGILLSSFLPWQPLGTATVFAMITSVLVINKSRIQSSTISELT